MTNASSLSILGAVAFVSALALGSAGCETTTTRATDGAVNAQKPDRDDDVDVNVNLKNDDDVDATIKLRDRDGGDVDADATIKID